MRLILAALGLAAFACIPPAVVEQSSHATHEGCEEHEHDAAPDAPGDAPDAPGEADAPEAGVDAWDAPSEPVAAWDAPEEAPVEPAPDAPPEALADSSPEDAPVADAAAPDGSAPRTSARVLFLGHSLIDHDMPIELLGLARLTPWITSYDYRSQVMPGAGLRLHREYPERFTSIQVRWAPNEPIIEYGTTWPVALGGGSFDVFIFTEKSKIEDSLVWENTVLHSLFFYDQAKAGNPSIAVYLYETWAAHPTTEDPAAWAAWRAKVRGEDLALWERVADEVMAARPGSSMPIVPAGLAMAALTERIEAGGMGTFVSPFDAFQAAPDVIHMSVPSAYYLACVVYSTIFRVSPEGLGTVRAGPWKYYNVVEDEPTRTALQRLAWEVVTSYPRSGVR